MSDYLSNLVARNLGWANTVQPRRRSLFEPPAEVAGTVWSSPQLEKIESGESIPLGRVEDSFSGARQQPPSPHPSISQLDSNLSSEIPTILPTVGGEQLTPPTENSSDLALDSVPQQSVFEPIATPANPPQLQRQINTPTPPSFSATESGFTATAQPNPAGLRKQGSKKRESSTEPKKMGTQQTNSQPLSPASSALEPSTLSPANTTEKMDAILPESLDISSHLAQLSPPEYRLDSREAEKRKISSVDPNIIERPPPKTQLTDSELMSPSSPVPKSSNLPPITVTENRRNELIEEPSWELTSNSHQPESAVNSEQVPEAESQPARPFAKVARPQVTSLVAQARSPSVTAREQPTIRVSIGRIEVQAIAESQSWENLPPETSPVHPQPTVPRLSLEEYLKSRQGGRR